MPRNIYRTLTDMPKSKHHTRLSYSLESSCNWAVKLCARARAKDWAHLLSYSQAGKGGKRSLYVLLILDYYWALKYHLLTRWAKPDSPWGWTLTLDLSVQTDTEIVVNKGGNTRLLDTQLFPSPSEEKARGWMEYARGDIWPESHQLDCASLEHTEGYSKLHSEKAKLGWAV